MACKITHITYLLVGAMTILFELIISECFWFIQRACTFIHAVIERFYTFNIRSIKPSIIISCNDWFSKFFISSNKFAQHDLSNINLAVNILDIFHRKINQGPINLRNVSVLI